MTQWPLRLLLLPGEIVTNYAHLENPDDGRMVRLLVNMLFWNISILLLAVAFLGGSK